MEKEHIYKEREREGARVTPEYLDATRESVELRSRPRDPFPTVLSSSSSCVSSCGTYISSCLFSRFLSHFTPIRYLLPFLRGFCPRWKGNHGALRVTGPVVFFSSREDWSLHLHHPDCRFLISFPSPFSSFFLRAFHSCQAQALVVRLRPPFFFFCDS